MIRVKFFARLRDQLGSPGVEIASEGIASVAQVRDALLREHSDWAATLADESVLVAVNQTMAKADTAVSSGDEVAFFPPVTGG